jgi:hypothetical protein
MAENPSGNFVPLQTDALGYILCSNCSGGSGGGGSNAAAGTTGSAPPSSASYTAFSSGGLLVGVSSSNPFPITGSVTLGASASAIGSISNSSFGISGTLPAFAATPTVNLGTLNGAATAANQVAGAAAGTSSSTAMPVQGVSGGVAVPVSAASLPLPAGAATATNQTNTQGTVAPGTAATNSTLVGCVYNSTQPAPTTGQGQALNCDSQVNLRVAIMPTTGAGAQTYRAINAASSNMANRLATQGRTLYGWRVCNYSTNTVYLHFYNSSASPPVPGTTTVFFSDAIPASTCSGSTQNDVAIAFSSYIGTAITAGSLADSDTTTITTANTVQLAYWYQ